MKIFVKTKPNSKKEKIEEIKTITSDEKQFIVYVKEPPILNKANQAILKLLATYFKVPISKIKILSGFKSKQKIIEIEK